MAVLEIRKVGDPVLRAQAKPVRKIGPSLRSLVDDMLETMYAAKGVGLAAPQVGVSKQLVVVDVGEGPWVLFNPTLSRTEGEVIGSEGCLSVPGVYGEVKRFERVVATGLDREGRQIWIPGEGLLARALQHEIDHLAGVLFLDKALSLQEGGQEEAAED